MDWQKKNDYVRFILFSLQNPFVMTYMYVSVIESQNILQIKLQPKVYA